MKHVWKAPWRPKWFAKFVHPYVSLDRSRLSRGSLMWLEWRSADIDVTEALQFSSKRLER